jgi:uncharacterized protein YjdB
VLESRERELLYKIAEEVACIHRDVKRLLRHFLHSATLYFEDSEGVKLMPATIVVGKTATAVYTEWSGPSGSGSALPAAGPVAFTSSDPTNAPVDPASGIVTGVGATTATITGTDATNGLSASDTVTVTAAPPPVAQSATLVVTAN